MELQERECEDVGGEGDGRWRFLILDQALDLWNKESKRCKLWTLRRGLLVDQRLTSKSRELKRIHESIFSCL